MFSPLSMPDDAVVAVSVVEVVCLLLFVLSTGTTVAEVVIWPS